MSNKMYNTKRTGKTIRSIVSAILQLFVAMFCVITLTFFIAHVIPGSPLYYEGKGVSERVLQEVNKNAGYNKGIFIQYIEFIKELFAFDFGVSMIYSGVPVQEIILTSIQSSVQIGFFAVLLSIVSTCLFTVLCSSLKSYRQICFTMGIIGSTVPTFVFAVLFQWSLCSLMKVSPPFWDRTISGSIPSILTLSVYPTAYMTMIISNSVYDEEKRIYYKILLLKGVKKHQLLFRHALPNVFPSLIGAAIPLYVNTLVGSFIVEKVFAINGLGWSFIQSISNRDYPVILGLTFFYSLFFIIVTIVADSICTMYLKHSNRQKESKNL